MGLQKCINDKGDKNIGINSINAIMKQLREDMKEMKNQMKENKTREKKRKGQTHEYNRGAERRKV